MTSINPALTQDAQTSVAFRGGKKPTPQQLAEAHKAVSENIPEVVDKVLAAPMEKVTEALKAKNLVNMNVDQVNKMAEYKMLAERSPEELKEAIIRDTAGESYTRMLLDKLSEVAAKKGYKI